MSSSPQYQIIVGSYAENHYISNFRKSYAKARDITWDAIQQELCRLDRFLMTSKAEIITSCKEGDIIKCEFAVAGSRMSPHASGYRYIIYHEKKINHITVLLVYGKDNIPKKQNETVWWQQTIKNNYDIIKTHFPRL